MEFKTIEPTELKNNFFHDVNNDWMLITAGNEDKFNTMTASWGGFGIMWNKNVSFAFIRDSRYTLEFIDNNEYYTLSFFGGNKKKELGFCGSHSGKDTDKIKETGLSPVFDEKAPYFGEAELVFVCKKLYKQQMNSDCVIGEGITEKFYADNDWHEMFIGEIVSVLVRE